MPIGQLSALMADTLVAGKSSSRVSVKGANIKGYFETIERAAHLKSHADVIKLIAVQAKRDVLDGGSPAVVAELQHQVQLL